MSSNVNILQGYFTSTGNAQNIVLRSGVSWMNVYNWTVAAANQTTAVGVQYYWQLGMPQGGGIEYLKSNAANAANLTQALTTGGFTFINSANQAPGLLNNGSTGITAVSNATPPVVTVGSTAGMSAGNIVRVYNITNGQQIGGMDFTIGYNTFSSTTFSLDYMTTLGGSVGAAGSFRVIPWDPIFYPRRRYITQVSTGTTTQVTLSVTHGYQVGQEVRFIVPDVFGMTQLNGLQGSILSINTATTGSGANSITVDINSSGFTAFAYPATTAVPITFAEVVPIGENTATALANGVDILTDATLNTAFIGMQLAAGANSPAGQSGNLIYWVAGTSFDQPVIPPMNNNYF